MTLLEKYKEISYKYLGKYKINSIYGIGIKYPNKIIIFINDIQKINKNELVKNIKPFKTKFISGSKIFGKSCNYIIIDDPININYENKI